MAPPDQRIHISLYGKDRRLQFMAQVKAGIPFSVLFVLLQYLDLILSLSAQFSTSPLTSSILFEEGCSYNKFRLFCWPLFARSVCRSILFYGK